MGEVEYSEGIGSQLTHARNDLDALIVNVEHKGNFSIKESKWEYGIKYTHEDIRDRMNEFEVIDSAGFSIRPPILPGKIGRASCRERVESSVWEESVRDNQNKYNGAIA